jgi:hypothetical protein
LKTSENAHPLSQITPGKVKMVVFPILKISMRGSSKSRNSL